VGDLIGHGHPSAVFCLCENHGDCAVERKLDEHTRAGRYRPPHRRQKTLGAPVQRQARHDENEIAGVQIRDCDHRVLPGELVTGFPMSTFTVATAACLRIIIASATMIQYSPSNFARKMVSGDTRASGRWLAKFSDIAVVQQLYTRSEHTLASKPTTTGENCYA
jgi:hypothetical protein